MNRERCQNCPAFRKHNYSTADHCGLWHELLRRLWFDCELENKPYEAEKELQQMKISNIPW